MPEPMGKTLVVSALTQDARWSIGCWPRRTSIASMSGRLRPTRSAGTSRTRGTSSSTSTRGARTRRPGSREDPDVHRRRRRDVLRELPARQRARLRAHAARPRRRAHAGLHPDTHRRHQRQRRQGVLQRHQRLPRAALAALQTPAEGAAPRARVELAAPAGDETPDQGRSAEPRRADRLDAARRAGLPARRDREAPRLAEDRTLRHRQSALPAAAGARRADQAHAEGAGGAARSRGRTCSSTASASRTSSSRST
jgi:hypothetical protein